nr:PREDICTED: uncharacterized protein LOC103540767 isoform X2 [Equus przewalskii]
MSTRGDNSKSMSHEPKSPSLGMLSTATRTTATVNPLTPSPLNGALVPSGSPATSSALSAQAAPSSSFAAALRKLAKQAEEPRGKRRARQAAARGGTRPCLAAQTLPSPQRAGAAVGEQPSPAQDRASRGLCRRPAHAPAPSAVFLLLFVLGALVGAVGSGLRTLLDPRCPRACQPQHPCLLRLPFLLSATSVLPWLQEPLWGRPAVGTYAWWLWWWRVDVLGHRSPQWLWRECCTLGPLPGAPGLLPGSLFPRWYGPRDRPVAPGLDTPSRRDEEHGLWKLSWS